MSDEGRLVRLSTVGVPMIIGLVLCLVELPTRSLWIDESATLSISSQHGAALWAAMRHDGGNMLAYYALEHVLIGWFGSGTWVLRLPSAIAAAASAGAVAAIANRLFGRRVGLAAGVIAAVSLPIVFWGQDARAYTLLVLFVCLSYWFLVGLVLDRDPPASPARLRLLWLGYVLSLVAASYMSLVAVLVVPAQLLALVWYRRRLRYVASALVVTAAAIVPLAVIAHERGSGQLFWVPRPTLSTSLPIGDLLASTGSGSNFAATATRLPLLILTAVALVAVAVVAVVRRPPTAPPPAGQGALRQEAPEREAPEREASRWVSRSRFSGVLVAAWLVVPVVLVLLESLVGQSLWQARYALISLPAVAVALSWGCLATGLPRVVGWAAVLVLVVLRAAQVWPTYGVSVENWPAATRLVLDNAKPGDCVAFYPSDARMPFAYYLPRLRTSLDAVPLPILPRLDLSVVRPFVEDYVAPTNTALAGDAQSCRSIWLVSSHAGNPNNSAVSKKHVEAYFRIVTELQYRYLRTTHYVVPSPTAISVWHFWGGLR